MSGRSFVDTNVLVYLFDRDAPGKQQRAREILAGAGETLVISTQVLQEFYVAVTRKLATPLPAAEAESAVRDLATFDVLVVDVPLVQAAIATARTSKLAFWDALIIESARSGGCTRLFSEDLQDGQTFGRLRVENPFAGL
jgi:predicted nucleic acid-binding protein